MAHFIKNITFLVRVKIDRKNVAQQKIELMFEETENKGEKAFFTKVHFSAV